MALKAYSLSLRAYSAYLEARQIWEAYGTYDDA